jgi:hypothetical protein
MTVDDLLFAIIMAGIGLSGAYVRSELLLHMRSVAIRRSRRLRHREFRTSPPKLTASPPKSGR